MLLNYIHLYYMAIDEKTILNNLENYNTTFKNIKRRMIQNYPNYENTQDKKPFLNAKTDLESLLNKLTILETKMNAEIKTNNRIIKKSDIKVGSAKLRFDNSKKKLKNNLNTNTASETLKINKYDENVREYLETFFYLFIIYLTSKFIRK
uniref:Uncharacterized protein n=1 Tax=viral metagenome TaxID=1070528 RepID=A0A6C0C5F3_9ZZZZ